MPLEIVEPFTIQLVRIMGLIPPAYLPRFRIKFNLLNHWNIDDMF